jgi:hypothetical protein
MFSGVNYDPQTAQVQAVCGCLFFSLSKSGYHNNNTIKTQISTIYKIYP